METTVVLLKMGKGLTPGLPGMGAPILGAITSVGPEAGAAIEIPLHIFQHARRQPRAMAVDLEINLPF